MHMTNTACCLAVGWITFLLHCGGDWAAEWETPILDSDPHLGETFGPLSVSSFILNSLVCEGVGSVIWKVLFYFLSFGVQLFIFSPLSCLYLYCYCVSPGTLRLLSQNPTTNSLSSDEIWADDTRPRRSNLQVNLNFFCLISDGKIRSVHFFHFLFEYSPSGDSNMRWHCVAHFLSSKFATTTSMHVRGLLQKSASLRRPARELLLKSYSQLKSSFTSLFLVMKPICGSMLCLFLKSRNLHAKKHFSKMPQIESVI